MSAPEQDTMTPERRRFEETWRAPTGFGDWFKTVNNQPFGNRFMFTAFLFFLLGGVQALLMRLQLAVPENDLLGPEIYNQLFTMHGSTMMYLVILPFLEGLAIYLLPLMLGTREMAFPRMSAFSYWVYLFGGMLFYTGYLFNAVPNTGWFVYPPVSLNEHAGLGLDFLLVGLGFIEIAGVGTGVEIVATVLKFRAPGMSLGRLPLFAWAWLVTGVMIIFAFATLFGATVLLELDRAAQTCFFRPRCGGTPLLWQHLFWFFGHPDVYIMFIPATGMVSMIVPTFARRPIAGYTVIAVAIVVTGFVSFGLWVHHMFTAGLPLLSFGFFAGASTMIALVSGAQVFAWLATLWRSKPNYKTPFLFVLGFLFIFVLGGITGVMVAMVPFDWQVHDTYFVVAHFHYVLIGGVIFPILAALHYWLPLIINRQPNEALGRWSFWLIFLGFNFTFFPMHIMGLEGLPRRVYTYSHELGLGGLNMLASISSFVLGAGFLLVAINVLYSRKYGKPAEQNPWNAGSLEWALTPDMPNYIFLQPPILLDRDPLWKPPLAESDEEHVKRWRALAQSMEHAPSEWRATLITHVVTGEPQAIQRVSGPSYFPVITALCLLLTSVATLFKGYLVAVAGVAFTVAATIVWLWPRHAEWQRMRESEFAAKTSLPVEPTGSAASPWWATIGVLCVIGTIFGVLFYSYLYLRIYSVQWPQGGIAKPDPREGAFAFGGLLCGMLPLLYARRGYERGVALRAIAGVGAAISLGCVALFGLLAGSLRLSFGPTENAYTSIFHTTIWHMAALSLGGLLFLSALLVSLVRRPGERSGYMTLQLQITELYWYFTGATGAIVYGLLYLSPWIF